MANEVVGIDIVARLDKFRTEMAQLPVTASKEAKAMTLALSREIKAAEAAAKKAAAATAAAGKGGREGAKGFGELGDVAGKTGQNAAKLRGILSSLSPELGSVAGLANDAADGVEVFAGAGAAAGVAALAVAAAVGTVYLAYRIYTEDASRAEATSKMTSAAFAAQIPILDSTRDATIDLQVSTGALTEEQARLQRASQSALDAYVQATAAARTQISALRQEQASVFTQYVDAAEELVPSWTPVGLILDALTTNTAEYQGQVDALQGTLTKAIDRTGKLAKVTKENVKADERAKKAKEGHAAATNELEAAFSGLEEAAKTEGDRTERVTGAITSLLDIEKSATTAILDEKKKMLAVQEEQIAQIGRLQAAASLASQTDTEREAIRTAATRARVAVEAQAAADIAAADVEATEKASTAAAEAVQKRVDDQAKMVDTIINGTSAFLSATTALVDTSTKKGFNTQKRIRQAEAAMAAPAAILNAYNDGLSVGGPAGLVLGPAMAALAAATTAVQVRAIGKAKFHLGGFQGGAAAPDEYSATLIPGEAVLSRQGRRAMGDDQIRQANGGVPSAPVRVIAETHYRHQSFDRFMVDNLRSGGAIQTAINTKTGVVGHRDGATR